MESQEPRRKRLAAGAIFLLPLLLIYWLFWGRILLIDTGGHDLSEFFDLTCFEVLRPDMTRSEITRKMGQPQETDIPYKEPDYVEVRWIYKRPKGLLNYYVEKDDSPGGSVEFVPNRMTIDEFMKTPLGSLTGKRFIEVRRGKKLLMSIRLKHDRVIKEITWFTPS